MGSDMSDVPGSQGLGRTIWGGVVPLGTGLSARNAIRVWAAGRGLRRLLLVRDAVPGGAGSAAEDIAHDLPISLEAVGLAVFPFDHAGGASTAAVAEGVGAYHFDQCDAVVGIGGAAAIDMARLIAFMTGQRHPLTELAAAVKAADPGGVAPCLAVAADLSGVASVGAASVLLDDRGCPFLLRDPALRPASAVYCPRLDADDRAAFVAALVLDAAPGPTQDATQDSTGESGEARDLAAALMTVGDAVTRATLALRAAGLLERCLGPARVFAVFGEVHGDIPQEATLACLTEGLAVDAPASGTLRTEIADQLDRPRSGRAALDALPLDALAHVDPATLPVDISGVLVMLGRDIPAPRRRGGRGGAARGRRSE